MKDAMTKYNQWLNYEGLDEETRRELQLLKDEGEIYDRFYKQLEFGTGGLRGVLGAGTNRMNIYTVRSATQGLADYINDYYAEGKERYCGKAPTAAIAYDSRIKSDVFAQEAAKVLMANGIGVYLYPKLMPTPALSFAVRYYQCCTGIMITASHNPAKYNGFKVYNEEGCQMTLEDAAEVLKRIEKIDIFADVKTVEKAFQLIPEEVDEAFYAAVERESMGIDCQNLSVVYTPLNGTGNIPVRTILQRIGVEQIEIVAEQELPDGNFPTCPYPNPEKREALQLGLALCESLEKKVNRTADAFKAHKAKQQAPDLLLATDPDCDRVGIAVRSKTGFGGAEYCLITGNEVGVLLLDFICMRRGEATKTSGVKPLPPAPIAMKTIVTTKMAADVAANYGVTMLDLLTGFKFIGEQIGLLEKKGEQDRFIFGFEESYGYLSGAHVRDKDAVNASMLICEMAAYYKEKNMTLLDRLEELYEKYGYYRNDLMEFAFEGAAGMEKMAAIMKRLRDEAPQEVIGKKIVEIADYEASQRRIIGGIDGCDLVAGTKPIDLPKSDVLAYVLADGSSFIVRPSGTEPKLKVYLSAKGGTQSESESIIEELKKELNELILQ